VTRPAPLILALAAALCLLAVVMARRERPVTATWPEEHATLRAALAQVKEPTHD
jgi:hypothetical protein